MTHVQQFVFKGDESEGAITPFGAHVLSWGFPGETPVIWLSEKADLSGNTPIRGGIPICLPWFNSPSSSPVSTVEAQYNHGFARISEWTRFEDPELADDPSTVIYELRHRREDCEGVFPHSFNALCTVTAGNELTVSLQVTNTDDHPFTFEEALHTYIQVGDIKDATISGLEGATYVDELKDGRTRTQFGEVMFTGPIDRAYNSSSSITLADPRSLRIITIEKHGSASTVVWNPWVEGAQKLADMGDAEWMNFVCIETANVGANALELEPNRVHTMSVTIRTDYFL
ncbi:D-hexose-6-phosphate mutarotase [Schaalia vaccimaxillae]|uniref:D-hexose-6-phosphate mutarotase n=1 Tax=Schaalia vaccimaxillae TaxID=183916 RepID=UPI00041A3A0B|nr:D-hexose-6-phosphate mutarotase [Schaalia vaccimaxillae]